MSGNNNTANNTNDYQTFTGETSEFGMRVFSDPHTQESYKNFEDEYKKKYVLKQAYDKQEFLRKMRIDIRREYLTRKKQVKHLQKDAAIDFRNAEMSLQEHYAGAQEKPFSIRAIDISAPLVSQVTLPAGDVFDVNTFHPDTEFEKVVGFHKSLSQQQNESKDQWMKQEQQRQRQSQDEWEAVYAQASWNKCVTQQEEDPSTPHCDQSPSIDIDIEIDIDTDTEALNIDNKWRMPMTASEKMILEKGEAAQNQRDEFPQCYWTYIGTHDAIDHAGWVLNSVKRRRANAGMTDEEHECDDCPAILLNEPEPASAGGILITKSKSKARKSANNKKKNAAASAAKARVAKKQQQQQQQHQQQQHQQQQQQQQQQKFVPLQVTINDNRSSQNQSEALSAMLSASKIEINLPKKNLQNASREAMKRHNQKWNRINAQNKQSAARGTKIPEFRVYSYSDEE
jgi:hypothetical protein